MPSEKAASTDTSSSDPAPAPPSSKEERRGRLRTRVRDARSSVDETKRSLLERAERERDRHESVRALYHLVEEDRGRGGGLLAGGLAYRLFIWMLPAALVATSLLQLFADLGDDPPSETAKGLGMGAAMAATVARAAEQTGQAAGILLILGLALMLWASRGVLKALRLVSSLAWAMRAQPPVSTTRQTLATAGVLIALPALGFVIAPLYGGSFRTDVVATLIAVLALAAVATWAFGRLPHPEDVGWFAFVPGAILFALGIEFLRLATALYFAAKLDRVDDLYGAFGFAAVFMTYLYLLARLVVVALMVNAAAHQVGHSRSSAEGPT